MNDQQNQGAPITRVDFPTNIWLTVAKSFDGPGLPCPARDPRYKPQVLFTLVDGRRMYLPQEVADRITELGVRRGEPFQIGKHEWKDGQRKGVKFAVRLIPAPAPTPQRAATPVRHETQTATTTEETPLAKNLRASIDAVNSRKTGSKEPAPLWPDEDQPRPTPQQPQPAKTAAAAVTLPNSMPRVNGLSNGSTTPEKIPYDVAFDEVLEWMASTLERRHEQWTDQARQNFVSTILIGMQREGWIVPWRRKQAS